MVSTRSAFVKARYCLVAFAFLGAVSAGPTAAFNYVTDANGTWWGIQDAAPPRVDTGSIRATQVGPGQAQPGGFTQVPGFTTSINGFGGIKVLVQAAPRRHRDDDDDDAPSTPRLNGEILRGYGLTFDGVNRFTTTQSIDFGGVTISRSVFINNNANWGRWLDSFTNTTKRPVTIKAAFGGQSGAGSSGPNSSSIVNTSSGDAIVTAADAWVEAATPLAGTTPVGGPQVTVIGTPTAPAAPFSGAMTFAGNWLFDTFHTPLSYIGHEGNFQAYVNTITLQPGTTRSLLHFVVLGQMVTAASSPGVRAAVEATASGLAAAPEIGGLTLAEVCSIDNFNVAALRAHGFNYADCTPTHKNRKALEVAQAPVPKEKKARTSVRYDVVGKTIGRLRADMESGVTTSQEITQAYLDRIEFYDKGQFGFNAYEVVATDAMKQARAADRARRSGATGALLGIPIAVKNLYDTFDMPTTNGSMVFEGFRPARDAFQVARLREAGAVIIGKAALEEYATFGSYSNDAWGQVWNVFNPSKSAIASSGGSGSALAANLAAGAMGSQTGDSLYGPASAASLVTLRGTDGLESGTGVMPLVYLTDFGGTMARSVPDLADMLNVVVAVDPADPETSAPGRHTPADWRSVLNPHALQGKRIGYIPSAWVDPLGTTNTTDAEKAALKFFADAGATIVEMGVTVGGTDTPPAPAPPPGDIRAEGWGRYIDSHPELATQGFPLATVVDVDCSQKKIAYVRAAANPCEALPPRLTAAQVQAFRDYRRGRQATAKTWMDTAGADHRGVDAVVYPGLLSDISVNDGGGGRTSFGRRDTPSAANGIPTVAFPVGYNNHGQPINIQLLGRAWDDDKIVGMAYAFEKLANAAGRGHVEATTAPPLPHHHGDHDDDKDKDR
jgi:amidase